MTTEDISIHVSHHDAVKTDPRDSSGFSAPADEGRNSKTASAH
jgi:hypothetical protein